MLFAENVTALAVFVMLLAAFATGYALRNWTDGTRAEFRNAFTYRHGSAEGGAEYRR